MNGLLRIIILVALGYACATSTSPAPKTVPPVTTRYPPNVNCGYEQVGNSGFISSPKFPDNYPNNADCAFFIQLEPKTTGAIKLIFQVFEVERSDKCKADSLKVHDGENGHAPVIANLCGKEAVKPIITSGKAVYLHFVTDVANTARGFNITWERASCEEAGGECAKTCQHGELEYQRGTCKDSALKCCKAPPPPSTICGKRFITGGSTSYIVNGIEAKPNSWPWMLSLQISTTTGHFCGAVLLSDEWAVTSAQCVNDLDAVTVVAGEHDLSITSGDEVSVDTSKIIVHEDFINSRPLPNDIALLKLSKKLKLGPKIFPVCFPQKEDMEFWPDDDCYITGWGSTKGTGDSTLLNEVGIPAIPQSLCTRSILETQICAGDGLSTACYRDGGGPLVCKKGGEWFLAGVSIYWNRRCRASRRYPSVYTRVSKYKTWVDEKIKANGGY